MLEMTIRSEMKGTLVPTLDLGLLHAVILVGQVCSTMLVTLKGSYGCIWETAHWSQFVHVPDSQR